MLSAESNHLKVTPTPEPLSLTISIFRHLVRPPERRKTLARRPRRQWISGFREKVNRPIDRARSLIEKIVPLTPPHTHTRITLTYFYHSPTKYNKIQRRELKIRIRWSALIRGGREPPFSFIPLGSTCPEHKVLIKKMRSSHWPAGP